MHCYLKWAVKSLKINNYEERSPFRQFMPTQQQLHWRISVIVIDAHYKYLFTNEQWMFFKNNVQSYRSSLFLHSSNTTIQPLLTRTVRKSDFTPASALPKHMAGILDEKCREKEIYTEEQMGECPFSIPRYNLSLWPCIPNLKFLS